jgi:hypothetical protein
MGKATGGLDIQYDLQTRKAKTNSWKTRSRDVLFGVALAVLAGKLVASLTDRSHTDPDGQSAPSDPAKLWKDDVRPIYPVKPWDISTDFPYPRKLEYEVTEGTWLRLDVHPKTGEVVFDMLGTRFPFCFLSKVDVIFNHR